MSVSESTPRRAVVHRNLLLIRTADGEQMESFLGRATVRTLLVRRVAPDVALFPRSAMTTVRRRLEDMETPFVLSELPAVGDALGSRK